MSNMNDKFTVKIERDAQGTLIITGQQGRVQVISAYNRTAIETVPYDTTHLTINPYRGLAAFQEFEANRFFGREQLTLKLWEKLAAFYQSTQQGKLSLRFLPLLAPSGMGKSSLLRAGLIPELARRGLPITPNLRVAILTPGVYPLQNLSVMLARLATQDITPFAKARIYIKELSERDGLRQIAAELPEIENSPVVLVIDQFEELYTLCKEPFERTLFIDNLLLAAADKSLNISVITAMCSEFLTDAQTHPTLYQTLAKQAYIVPFMNVAELRDSIVKPAQLAGIPWEMKTVQQLIEQTKGQKYALPLLQLTLTYLWDMRQHGSNETQLLESIDNLPNVLELIAQQLYTNLADSERKLAQSIFLKLVKLNDNLCQSHCSCKIAESQADDKVKEILRYYANHDSHFITLSHASQQTATITHEVLFHHWSTLKQWLLEYREEQLLKQRLSHAAHTWESLHRPIRLLWHSGDLARLEPLYDKSREEFTELQLIFFHTSKRRQRYLRYRNRLFAILCIGIGILGLILSITQFR